MKSSCPSVKCLTARKFLTGWKPLSLCYCAWFNHRQSGTYGVSCPATPYHQCHTHSPLFLSLSLQIRAAKLYCYFIQAGAATGGPAKAGYLVNGALFWAGDTSWSSPIFLIECFNTSYRETAVLQISMFSVTMINVLLRLCRSLTISKGLFSFPPSQHRHLNTTHTYIQHTHRTHILNPSTCQKRQSSRGCDHSA